MKRYLISLMKKCNLKQSIFLTGEDYNVKFSLEGQEEEIGTLKLLMTC